MNAGDFGTMMNDLESAIQKVLDDPLVQETMKAESQKLANDLRSTAWDMAANIGEPEFAASFDRMIDLAAQVVALGNRWQEEHDRRRL